MVSWNPQKKRVGEKKRRARAAVVQLTQNPITLITHTINEVEGRDERNKNPSGPVETKGESCYQGLEVTD